MILNDIYLCIFMSMGILPSYIYVCVPPVCSAYRSQKEPLELLGQELQMIVSDHVWVLEIKTRSSGRAIQKFSNIRNPKHF